MEKGRGQKGRDQGGPLPRCRAAPQRAGRPRPLRWAGADPAASLRSGPQRARALGPVAAPLPRRPARGGREACQAEEWCDERP